MMQAHSPNEGKKNAARVRAQVLTLALKRVHEQLQLSRQELSAIIGTSEASLSRLFTKSDCFIDPATKEGQLALLLLHLYRSLYALFGGNLAQCSLWLRHENKHLDATPIKLLQSIEGLVLVVQYLDDWREKG